MIAQFSGRKSQSIAILCSLMLGTIALGSRSPCVYASPAAQQEHDALVFLATIKVGSAPKAVVNDSLSHLAFVASAPDGVVTVLDGETLHVQTSLQLAQPAALAVDPELQVALIAQDVPEHPMLTVLRERDGAIAASVPLSGAPVDIALDLNTHTVYVVENPAPSRNLLEVIRLAGSGQAPQLTIMQRVADMPTGGVDGTAIDSTNHTLFFSTSDRANPSFVTALSDVDFQLIAVTGSSAGVPYYGQLAVDPRTHNLVIAPVNEKRLAILPVGTGLEFGTVFRTAPLTGFPWGVAIDSTTGTIYVTDIGIHSEPPESNTVSAVNETTASEVTSSPVGKAPWGVAVDATTHRVFVANSGDGTVTVLQGLTTPTTTTPAALPTGGSGGMAGCTPP